jgi:hypothetical protein
MSRADDFIDTLVERLADENDEVFIGLLAQYLHTKDDAGSTLPIYTRLLYHPAILTRLARIRREDPALFLGSFATALRRRRDLYYPDVMEALDQHKRVFDPFAGLDMATLLTRPVQPVRWLVPGLIAEGLTILAGSPKSGKSYLAYALTLATAVYGQWMQQWEVARGPVVFLSLEDDPDDTRLRLAELDPDLTLPPGQITFIHSVGDVPSFEEGLMAWLTEAMERYRPRLLVIDPISYLYSLPKRGNGDLFQETRQMLLPLRWLGKHYQCAVVALDHRRKRSRDDTNLFDTLHGSIAKQAVVDSLLMVERDQEQLTLGALVRRGKDVTYTLTMQFRDGRCWLTYGGEATPQGQYGDFRQQVYTALLQYRIPMTVKDLMAELELPDNRQIYQKIHNICMRGVKSKELERTTRGAFVLATPPE